ncbi:MAG: peptide ABC transporter substrate-binding protein [Anaerolineae bacterium]|nr:peptide ABC transporter substrate-binding protein [Anaerolineae bacterium]
MRRVMFAVLVLLLLVAPAMAQDGNMVNVVLQQELDTLNPIYTQMWFATTVQDLLFAPAWWIDDTGSPVPALVTEIPSVENGGVSADGTVITLHLRDDAKWSDGEAITSADFVFTYDMIMNDANTPSSRFPWDEKISGIEAPDALTVVVTYKEAYAAWLATLFSVTTPPLPEHVLRPVFESEGTLDNAEWNRSPNVTSGPFLFQEWEAGSHITLTANPDYFGGAPKVDGFFIRFVPDDATVVASLVSGDSDVGTFIALGDTPALEEAGVNIELVNSGYNEGWFFNMSAELGNPALQDVNVRRALVMAFNRDQINADLNLGITYTGASFWEQTPYANPDVKALPFDLEGAAAMLDAAGWVDSNGDGTRDKDGVELSLRYVTNTRQIRQDVQAVVQQDMASIGVGIQIENYPSDLFFASYADGGPCATGQFDICEYSVAPNFPDPDTSRFTCAEVTSDDNPEGINDNHYCNPALDELFAAEGRETDFNARVAIFQQIDQMFADELFWIPVWYDPDLWAINGNVTGALVSGADPLWNAVSWEKAGS